MRARELESKKTFGPKSSLAFGGVMEKIKSRRVTILSRTRGWAGVEMRVLTPFDKCANTNGSTDRYPLIELRLKRFFF